MENVTSLSAVAPVPWYSPNTPLFLSRSNVNDQADIFGIALPAVTERHYATYSTP